MAQSSYASHGINADRIIAAELSYHLQSVPSSTTLLPVESY
jgi:hypothetical protein